MKFINNKSEFLNNTATLASGTVIAQLLPLLLSPWLSRIYTPEDFAIMALVLPFITIGALLSTLKLELAIVIPKTDKEALNILLSAFALNILISVLLLFLTFLTVLYVPISFLGANNKHILWAIPIGIFAVGTYQILNYWSTRCKTFKNNAFSKITQASTTLFVSILLGYILFGAQGLIIGFVSGYFLGSVVLFFRLKGAFENQEVKLFDSANMSIVLSKYKNFALITTPHAFLDILTDQGIIYILKIFFIERVIGSFAFAYRYTRAPLSIITSSVGQVFYQKASQMVADNMDIRPMMFKIQKNLFLMALLPFLILFLYTPHIFAFVFSEDYRQAGEIVRYLLPFFFANFVVSPISSITLILKKQKQAFLITMVDLIFRVSAIVVGGIFWDFRYSFALISVFCVIILTFATLWYYKIANPKHYISY